MFYAFNISPATVINISYLYSNQNQIVRCLDVDFYSSFVEIYVKCELAFEMLMILSQPRNPVRIIILSNSHYL